MRKDTARIMAIHIRASHQKLIGSPPLRCTVAAITPAPAGIGMPTKYFLPGRPGFDGLGLCWILKRASRLAPATRKTKDAISPNCNTRAGNADAPRSANQSQRNPHTKARTAGATPNVITSAKESNSRPKSLVVLVMRAMHRVGQGKVSCADVGGREEGRQNVHAFTHAAFLLWRKLIFPPAHWGWHLHLRTPD